MHATRFTAVECITGAAILAVLVAANATTVSSPSYEEIADLGNSSRNRRRPLRPQTASPTGTPQLQLLETAASYARKPRQKQMERNYLRDLLGDDYDPTWMAEEKPLGDGKAMDSPAEEGWSTERMRKQLESLNLTDEIGELGRNKSAINAVKRWMLSRASCPVNFVWENVGPLFWPRWVRRGECVDRHGACSWPPGMHCVPASSTTFHLLRWHCRNRKRRSKGRKQESGEEAKKKKQRHQQWTSPSSKKSSEKLRPPKNKPRVKCEWMRVPYPVTMECFCTC